MSNATTRRSLRRVNMSWRKPVPQFVPSRPSSVVSISPGFAPFAAVGAKIAMVPPPLPPDWREVIEKALVGDEPTPEVENRVSGGKDIVVEPGPTNTREEHEVMALPPARTHCSPSGGESVMSRNSISSTLSKHVHAHQHYHPPTPPATSHSKLPRIDIFNDHDGHSYNIVYPDLPPTTTRTPSLLRASIFPVHFDPTATMTATVTAMGSREDFYSQYNHDLTGTPKQVLPSRQDLRKRRQHKPSLWDRAWKHLGVWGGSVKLKFVRLFGFTRTPGAVKY